MNRILVILGPTAGGKSDLAVALARRLNGEILGADSMQVYRELNAGTAKPSAAQRAAMPHHLVDVVDPTEAWTVADWLEAAEALIADLHAQGKLPVVVGGTNLYLKALLEGMFEGPPADEVFRASLKGLAPQQLHRRLLEVDPDASDRIDPNNRKRLVRALEVHHLTGRPISALQAQWSAEANKPYRHDPILIGMRFSPDVINRRINARVKTMFRPEDAAEDLVTETRRLLDAGRLGAQARQALGTKQIIEHLEGRATLEDTFERVKIETRRFAKAQRTWLKRFRGVHWLEADEASPGQLAENALFVVQSALKGT